MGEKRKEGRIGEEGSRERHKENDEHGRVKRTHETKLFIKFQHLIFVTVVSFIEEK